MHTEPNHPSRRKAATERILAELAFLGALLLYGFLYYGFRAAPVSEQHAAKTEESSCIFVPAENPVRLADWEKMLVDWSWLMDPTIAARPDETQGFSRTRLFTDPEPVTPFPAYAFTVTPVQEIPLPAIALSHPFPALGEALGTAWRCPPIPLPEAPPIPTFPSGIVWRRPSGALLTDPPTIDLESLQHVLEDYPQMPHPTAIEISRRSQKPDLPRLRVVRSSGSVTLDGIVLTALQKEIFFLNIRENRQQVSIERSYWPPKGEKRTVEVDWSLFSRPAASAPPSP